MNLTVKEDSKNYACSVVEIKELFPIEGADAIVRVVVNGNNVVISKDTQVGMKMLYFCAGTQIEEAYCHKNNLYDKAEENHNKEKRGFISFKNRRVRAIKLKGVISDGMLMPLDSLNSFLEEGSINSLKVGDEFTDINGNSLCKKYFVPVRNGNIGGKAPKKLGFAIKDIIIENQFRLHTDTEHFVKHLSDFSLESEIIITRKIHGSSLVLSNVLVKKNLSLKDKIFNFLGAEIPTKEYGLIWSSGKPKSKLPKGVESSSNKWETPNPSFYTADIWARAAKELRHTLEKGISLYGEIVGEGIQGADYTYGKEYAIFIYRITTTNSDGEVYELSWEQIKNYCAKYGLQHVEEYFGGKVKELVTSEEELLEYLKNRYLDKSYPDCAVDEGVCIRLRGTEEIYKLKSPKFILGESVALDKEIVNIEDNQ